LDLPVLPPSAELSPSSFLPAVSKGTIYRFTEDLCLFYSLSNLLFAGCFPGEPIFSNIGRENLLFLGLFGANGFFFLVDVIEIGFKGRFRRFRAFSGDG